MVSVHQKCFSIIISHYNTPDLLERLLKTIPIRDDIEVIIVDDCSTLKIEKLKILKHKFATFCWLKTDCNKGGGCARNHGLNKASGKWILFIDSDDYFTSDFSYILDSYKNENYDIVYFKVDIIFSKSIKRCCTHFDKIDEILNKKEEYDKIKYEISNVLGKLYNTNLIKKYNIRFQETIISNDIMFSFTADFYAQKIKIDSRIFYRRIIRKNSVSHTNDKDKLLIKLAVHCDVYKFLKDKNLNLKNEKENLYCIINKIIMNRNYKYILKIIKIFINKNGPFTIISKVIINYIRIFLFNALCTPNNQNRNILILM